MKTAPIPTAPGRHSFTTRAPRSRTRHRLAARWLAVMLMASSAALPPSALAFTVRGLGETALIGHDLTDPEDDGDPDNNTNYYATFAASEEAHFGFGEGAFNVFDNRVNNGGDDKWCCGDQNNFPTNPISIDATFPQAIVLRRFTLTSGNDAPERDPLVWEIQGSNDGVNFTPIYQRNNPTTSVWTARNQVVEFDVVADFPQPAAYTTIRFITTATGTATGARFQLSEIEYFDLPSGSLVVTTTADENNGTSDPAVGAGTSLREALNYAALSVVPQTITFSKSTVGGAVNFYDGTARTITVTGTLPHIASDLTITGPGAKLLAVSKGQSVLTVDAGKTATLTGLTIKNGLNLQGSGINNLGTLTIQSCVITANTGTVGTRGAGIYNGGTLTIESCTVSNNPGTGTTEGGGLYNVGTATIRNSAISGNMALRGGGIFTSGTLTIRNSTVSGNTDLSNLGSAQYGGGGILNNGTLTVQNCTITGNTSNTDPGGGINSQSAVSVTLENSIVAGNSGPAGSPDIAAPNAAITSNGYNFIGNTTGISGGVQAGDKTFASTSKTLADLLETNAGVPVLKDNGGASFTVALVPHSPALDAGDPSFNPNNFTPPVDFDQRGLGFDRIVKGKSASAAAIVDIGAYEVQIITFAPGVAANGVKLDVSAGPLDLTGPEIGAMPPGGAFDGPGVDANGVFHSDLLDPGTYTITYTTNIPDAFDNMGSASFTVTIAAKDPYLRIIATAVPGGHGIDVPGEPMGTKFTQLGLASMDDADGGPFGTLRLVCARVRIKPAGGIEVPAIYQGTANTAVASFLGTPPIAPGGILVRGGDAAPDGQGGTRGMFASFNEPVFGSGYVAFGATLTGANVAKTTDTGLWSTLSGQLDLVVAEGGTARDDAGNAMTGVLFDQIQSYVLSEEGTAVTFVATVKGNGVNATNKTGVWQYKPTITRLLFRTGDTFNLDSGDHAVKSLKLFVPAKTIPGQRRSYATDFDRVMAFATFTGGHQGLIGFVDFGGGNFFDYLALENRNVGHPGIPSLNSSGVFAMRAGLSVGAKYTQRPGKVTSKDDQTIITGSNQFNVDIFAQEGSAVSSSIPDIFTKFEEPALNDHFATAFFADVTKPGLASNQKRVLVYFRELPGQFFSDFAILARTGTAAADLTGGEKWKSFTAMVLPNSDYGPVFLGTLSGAGVKATNGIGLWATDLDGSVRLLLRSGDMVPINGVHKTVSLITTLGAATDSPGQGRYVDLAGSISALLTFTDGSTALVRFGMPTPVP